MKPAAVAIVGGGVMGASVAWHLASRGVRDVVVFDRAVRPGEGSTGRATGGFRAQYATPINVRLSLLARQKLLRFRDDTGADPGYAQAGYLWLAMTGREMAVLREGRQVQHAEGLVEAVEVGPAEIARINPAAFLDGVVGGTFCPTDGFIRPLAILEGYLDAARRLGVRFEWNTHVTGLERQGERVVGVETNRGRVATGAVVNAAGPWAAGVAKMAGVDLPVTPLRRQVAATVPCALLPADMPMTIWAGDGFHLRVRDGRVLLLWPTPGVPGKPFEASVDPEWVRAVVEKAHVRVPVLREVEVDSLASWAGLYEMSPDKHAILGRAAGCENFYPINGSSGHGVMHAPALGQLLAEIICDGKATTLDVRALRPERFADGEPNPVSELL
jgi:glycine/D-amino acid oxidase-like deaminating enzyme